MYRESLEQLFQKGGVSDMENAVLEAVSAEPTIIERDVFGDDKLDLVKIRIAKLNKRAVAKGFPMCELSHELKYIGHELADGSIVENPSPWQLVHRCTGRVVPCHGIKLEFPKLAIGDWELLGALRPLQLGDGKWENLVNNVPGKEIPAGYAVQIGVCDHCGHKRHRTETFVVRNLVDGSYRSVGRKCIKDFLGHDPTGMLWVYEQVNDLSDNDGWEKEFGGKGKMDYDLPYILALSFKCIAVDGWVSGKMAEFSGLHPTSDTVSRIAGNFKPFDWSQSDWDEFKAARRPSDFEMDRAGQAIEWAKTKSDSGYERNANLIARVGRVTEKELGLAVSIAASFLRATTDEIVRKEKMIEIDEWYGVVGSRVIIDVVVIRVIPCETMYGTSGLHIMRTIEGHSLKWFATSGDWLAEGDVCKIKGSIKGHDTYRDKKQTTLSRVKFVEEKPAKIVKELVESVSG